MGNFFFRFVRDFQRAGDPWILRVTMHVFAERQVYIATTTITTITTTTTATTITTSTTITTATTTTTTISSWYQ